MKDSKISKLMIKAERKALKITQFVRHPDFNQIRNRKFVNYILDEVAKVMDPFEDTTLTHSEVCKIYKRIGMMFNKI